MEWEMILRLIYLAVGVLATGIPLVISLVYNIKKKIKANKEILLATTDAAKAQAEADSAQATLDMKAYAEELVKTAESTFKSVNDILKARGESAGSLKKEVVMSKLQSYAAEKGYDFDSEEWSKSIDDIVTLTREVNNHN